MDLKSNRYEIDFNETGFTVEIQIDMKLISMKLVSQLTPHGLEIRWIENLVGFSVINHPFGGTPISGNPHMFL